MILCTSNNCWLHTNMHIRRVYFSTPPSLSSCELFQVCLRVIIIVIIRERAILILIPTHRSYYWIYYCGLLLKPVMIMKVMTAAASLAFELLITLASSSSISRRFLFQGEKARVMRRSRASHFSIYEYLYLDYRGTRIKGLKSSSFHPYW